MRKRTITCISKNIFWYLIYLLPLILSVIYTWQYVRSDVFVLNSAVYGEGFDFAWAFFQDNNVLFNVLYYWFGIDEVGIVFESLWDFAYNFFGITNSALVMYFTYFIYVFLLHLFVDFLLFIPRLAHKWMNSFTETEDCD